MPVDDSRPTSTRRVYAIAPTQFKQDGTVDAGAMLQNLLALSEHGIVDVLLTGAYGEFQSLTDQERQRIVDIVAAQAPGRVMACAAKPSTTATVELANRLADAGADEIMVSPPLLAELSNDDILRHFEVLATRVNAPMVIYNNPVFGTDLQADQLSAIAANNGFSAIKQGTKAERGISATIDAVGRHVRVLGASDLVSVQALADGADGFTSTNSWVFPRAFGLIAQHAGTAQHALAEQVRYALEPYAAAVRELGQPRAVKAAMQLRGYAGTPVVRLPYVELDARQQQVLQDALRSADERFDALDAREALVS